jgi:3-dehydroquinate dehydratase-1
MSIHHIIQKSSLLLPGQVVGSVIDHESLTLAVAPAVAASCDLVEFRADALATDPPAVLRAMEACPVPALLTVRASEEGGLGQLSPSVREAIFVQLLPQAQLIDLEIAHLEHFPGVIRQAQRNGIPIIASFHDFHGTPDRATLEALVAKARAAGADAVKFATLLRSAADLAVLAAMQESAAVPLASMGMGPLGRVSRLLLAHLGSILNYGYLDQPTIPGQWPAQRLRELIAELRSK